MAVVGWWMGRWIVGKGKVGERRQINKGTGPGCGAVRSTQAGGRTV